MFQKGELSVALVNSKSLASERVMLVTPTHPWVFDTKVMTENAHLEAFKTGFQKTTDEIFVATSVLYTAYTVLRRYNAVHLSWPRCFR